MSDREERIERLTENQRQFLFWYMFGALETCNPDLLDNGIEFSEQLEPHGLGTS